MKETRKILEGYFYQFLISGDVKQYGSKSIYLSRTRGTFSDIVTAECIKLLYPLKEMTSSIS